MSLLKCVRGCPKKSWKKNIHP